MSGQVSFEVEHTRPVVFVRPHGVLDAYSAPDLRAVLLECMADQPTGVVVDTAGLTIDDDLGLTVLAGVARESERWPGTLFALVGDQDVHAAAHRLGITPFVTMFADRQTAVQVLTAAPPPPARRQRVVPDRNAPGLARLAVQEFCQELEVDGDGDSAQLVASELVTNAVVHAGTDIDLTLRLVAPLLHVAVRDGSTQPARIADIVDESSPSGRGLLLVDALSTAWGSVVLNSGKVVWATIRVRRSAPGLADAPDQRYRVH